MAESDSPIPEVIDDDIDWVSGLLGIDEFDEPRRRFLKSRETVDVSACPGSGKTTLIVSKLAILARKWPYRTRGVCVLSHTNVAREQIEDRLGSTVIGQRLLAYPHFIDTIHSFANHFLALPWLYSNGYEVDVIDDEIALRNRWFSLPSRIRHNSNLTDRRKQSIKQSLRVVDAKFNLGDVPWGNAGTLGRDTPTYKSLKAACEESIRNGFHCYDEMFTWANALLEDHPEFPGWIARRFPLVFLDEMQDTSDLQSTFLNKVFPQDPHDVVVQRVGDPNQTIFDHSSSGAATVGPFSDDNRVNCLEIPNSYRFGSEVAGLASPFAVRPVGSSGLCGIGPRASEKPVRQCNPAIFVFPNDSTEGVLKAYGAYVLAVLGKELAAEGPVTAVGHVHKDASEVTAGDAHYPMTVSHYWSGYSTDVSGKDPYPQTLAQYLRVAQALVADGRTLSLGCEKMACGVVELARRMGDVGGLKRKRRTHHAVVEALEGDAKSLAAYRSLLKDFLVEREPALKDRWQSRKDDIIGVAEALCAGGANPAEAESFLTWPQDDSTTVATNTASPPDVEPNVFRFSSRDGPINIRIGSIHSVKGQTHLATLLLSTYWYEHSAVWMMPWLLGERKNGSDGGQRDLQRLFHTYVAMTRPSHLLCLALPRSALGGNETIGQNIKTLQSRGWRVAELVDGAALWHD